MVAGKLITGYGKFYSFFHIIKEIDIRGGVFDEGNPNQ